MRTSWLERASLLAVGVLFGAGGLRIAQSGLRAAEASQAASPPEFAELRSRVDRLEGRAPDQAHAMADVGYQFSNLWFAAAKENWSLARFCLDESRSHLRWAVRIIPVRKTPTGEDLDLRAILEALESGALADVEKSIEARSRAKFELTYKRALEACYSCHKASGKPFIRPQVPTAPAVPILNFDPEARWPQ